jgi:hypothetical protein
MQKVQWEGIDEKVSAMCLGTMYFGSRVIIKHHTRSWTPISRLVAIFSTRPITMPAGLMDSKVMKAKHCWDSISQIEVTAMRFSCPQNWVRAGSKKADGSIV